MKNKILIAFLMILFMFNNVYAIGITPSSTSAGELTAGSSNTFGFVLENSYPYTMNISFEVSQSSSALNSYVTFTPSRMTLDESTLFNSFNVTIAPTSSLPAGNYKLIFKAIPTLPKNYSSNKNGLLAEGLIVSTVASSINFSIAETAGEGNIGGSGGAAAGAAENVTIRYKAIAIDVPELTIANEDFVYVIIKIRNVGEANIEELKLNLKSNSFLTIYYPDVLGSLKIGAEKEIKVKISEFVAGQNIVTATVQFDDKEQKTTFFVYFPTAAKGTVEKDCIQFKPNKFSIKTTNENVIGVLLQNKCFETLKNVIVLIPRLDYHNEFAEINEEQLITLNLTLAPGTYTYKIIASYEGGYSEEDLQITSYNIFPLVAFVQDKGLLALVLAVNMLFVLFIFRHYNHSFLRTQNEINEEEETIRRRLSAYAAHIEHNKEHRPSIPHQLMKLIYSFHVVEPKNYWDNNNGENWDVSTEAHSYMITYENPVAKKVYIRWTKDNWKTTYDVLMVKHKDKFEAKLRL